MSLVVRARRDLLRRAVAFRVQRLQLAVLSALSQHAVSMSQRSSSRARIGSFDRAQKPSAAHPTCPLGSPTVQPGLLTQPPHEHRQPVEDASLPEEGSAVVMADSRHDGSSPAPPPRGSTDLQPPKCMDSALPLQLAEAESASAGPGGDLHVEDAAHTAALAAKQDSGRAVLALDQTHAPASVMLVREREGARAAVPAVAGPQLQEKLPGSSSPAQRPAEATEAGRSAELRKERHGFTRSSGDSPLAAIPSRPSVETVRAGVSAAQQAEQAGAARDISAMEARNVTAMYTHSEEAAFSGRPAWDGELAAVFGACQEATVMQWRRRLAAAEPLMRQRRWRCAVEITQPADVTMTKVLSVKLVAAPLLEQHTTMIVASSAA